MLRILLLSLTLFAATPVCAQDPAHGDVGVLDLAVASRPDADGAVAGRAPLVLRVYALVRADTAPIVQLDLLYAAPRQQLVLYPGRYVLVISRPSSRTISWQPAIDTVTIEAGVTRRIVRELTATIHTDGPGQLGRPAGQPTAPVRAAPLRVEPE